MDKLPSLAHARMVEIYYQILDEPWPLQKLGWIWLELGWGMLLQSKRNYSIYFDVFSIRFSSHCLSSYLVWVTWNSHINYHKFQDLPNFDVPFPSFFPCRVRRSPRSWGISNARGTSFMRPTPRCPIPEAAWAPSGLAYQAPCIMGPPDGRTSKHYGIIMGSSGWLSRIIWYNMNLFFGAC